ncbi:MAG: TetR/AcrR family transcriptional regulator [Actinobacteria bacterium]|nr:TetR/AcrR family transcriptional regulator [Actinomycetota bacterium]
MNDTNTEALVALAPGAEALVEASKRLLMDGGMDALRVDKITQAAGQNRAMVSYYFGGKAALLAVVVDSLIHEAVQELATQAQGLPEGDARVDAHVDSTLSLMQTPEFLATLDVIPPAFRNDDLRERLAKLYGWYREVNATCLDPNPDPSQAERLNGLATLFVAVIDGLAIQFALDSESVDLDSIGRLLKEIVGLVLHPAE